MCLIIMQPAGVKLPAEHLENGWSHNPDGAGYMFVDAGGKLVIRKPFFKLKDLRKSYALDHAANGHSSPFVIHFRYATHGSKTEVNCHPHGLCGGDVGLAHNGVLRDFEPPYGQDVSDTVWFCRTVLTYRCAEHVVDEKFRGMLAEMIGPGNKFVLLRNTRQVSIVNEAAGVWDAGVWYSNGTYQTMSTFGRFKRSTGKRTPFAASSVLPVAYRERKADTVSLISYGQGESLDPWSELQEEETAGEELARLERELDDMDVEGWEDMSPEDQDAYVSMYVRCQELERQLDTRLQK